MQNNFKKTGNLYVDQEFIRLRALIKEDYIQSILYVEGSLRLEKIVDLCASKK